MSDFDAVFDKLPADSKAPRDLIGAAACEDGATECSKRHKRRGAYCISGLLVGFVVVAGHDFGAGEIALGVFGSLCLWERVRVRAYGDNRRNFFVAFFR
jgi:hypothetical protein